MQTTAHHAPTRVRARSASRAAPRAPLTQAQELEEMKAYVRQIKSSSKEDAVALLQRAGILDTDGEIAAPYRG